MHIRYRKVHASWTRQFFGYMAAVLLVTATTLSLLPVSQTRALTTTPTKMNFQGRLTDSAGTTMPDGLYNMKFRLFTVASGGTDVWNETRETTNRVQVTNGLFSVQLGAVTPISASLFASGNLYFEVELPTPATATCGTASCQTWTEGPMTTRSLLSTSAYAFNSETLDGLDSTGFIQNQNGSAQTSTNFWIDGTARSATVQAAAGLIAPGANSTSTFSVQNANTVAVFNIDTTNGEIEIGNYNGGTNPVNGKLVIGNSTNANLVSIVSGATSTSYTLTLPTAVGASGDCLKASDASGTLTFGSCAAGGGVTTVGALDGGTANANGATISGTTIYLQSASASYGGLVNTTTQTFAGAKTFNDSITLAAAKTITMTGGATASRPGSPTEGMIYYDTDTDRLITYSNGKWQTDRTDAVLVAASNSSQADKDAADYVADGTDDQVQINAALTAADPASGTRKTGKVFLFAGTYTTHRTDNSNATILIPNNTTLAGAGRGTLIQLGDIDTTDNLIENSDTATGTGVVIRDLRLDGQKTSNTAGTQHGIFFSGMGDGSGGSARRGAIVTGVSARYFRTSGLYLNYSSNNTITGNRLEGNNSAGIQSTYGFNNTITGNAAQGNSYGITSSQGSNVTINDNLAQGNTNYGVYVDSSSDNTVTGNIAQGNGNGIELFSSFDNTITGNIARINSVRGISIYDSTNNNITGNTIEGNSNTGVDLSASSNNIISSNKIHNTGDTTTNNGIYLDNSDSNTISGNDITDTSCGTGTSNCFAIYISGSTSDINYLSNNRFSDTDGDATATINDSGTGTVYVNQPLSVDGGRIANRTANNATAFTIQNASGVNILTADTSAGEVELGAAAQAGKLVINDGASSTVTLSLNTITGDNNYTLAIPAITGNDTFCLQSLGNCGLKKDAVDTSSAAVGAASYLYGFTNSSTAVASGVLKLDNGSNTGNTIQVTASANPGSGSALIYASNTNASPSGNLIDLQSGASPTSKFSVNAAGAVTASSTINGATLTGGSLSATAVNGLSVASGTVSVGTWNGTAITGAYGGTGHNTTAVGDLLVGAAGNTWNKLTIGGNGTCLKSNGTTATWDTCSAGASTLKGAYDGDADGSDAIIALTTTDGGIRLQDAATPLATAFAVEDNSGTAAYFSVSSAGVAMEDTDSRPTLLMDNSTHQLRVYEDVASSPRYAVMYYDTANNMAVFGASSGATQIGSPGTGGDINLSLSGAATDKLNASKTFSLTGAYSGSDFNFTRNLTGTNYAMTGNLLKVEDTSSFTGGSSSPNLLYINQNNTGATGNLILAQTGGATDKFKVDVGGNVTAAGDVSIAAGKAYTGAGAVTVSSASNTNLTLLAGGSGKVIVKPGADSSSSFEVQDSAGTAMILVDSSADQIKVGVSDDVGTVLVFDTKTGTADPAGTNGAMYYNSGRGKFRCYENGAWRDCIQNNIAKIASDVVNNNATLNTLQDVTGLSFDVKTGVTYRFEALIPYQSAATTTGSRWTLSGPAATLLSYKSTYSLTATTVTTNFATAYSIPAASNASSMTTTANVAIIEGMITPSEDGTVQVRFASEIANSAITAKAGGTLMWWEVY